MTTPVLFARLPRMTDPLGRLWPQPAGLRDRVKIFETHATIDERDWLALPKYDRTTPSGTYTGKVWRTSYGWLCWYGYVDEKANTIAIGSTRALVQTNGAHAR